MAAEIVCEMEHNRSYFLYAIPIPIIGIFQLVLFIQTLCKMKEMNVHLFLLIFVMQSSGLLYTFTLFFRFFIFTTFIPDAVNNSFWCYYFSHSGKIIPFIFAASFLLILLHRLVHVFKDSPFAIPKRQIFVLKWLIIFPFVIISILFLAFITKPCLTPWNPPDYAADDLVYCDSAYNASTASRIMAYIGAAWIVLANLTFGVVFARKLYTLGGGKDKSTTNVMVKVVLLTIISSFSTVFNWALFFVVPYIRGLFPIIDFFVNSLCIVLMLKYNQKHYEKLCCLCIRAVGLKLGTFPVERELSEIQTTEKTTSSKEEDENEKEKPMHTIHPKYIIH